MSKTNNATRETALEKLGIGTAPIPAIPDLLDLLFAMEKKITMCLVGDTGIGKTPIVFEWAKRHNAYVHVMNFGHMSPEDVAMAMFAEDGNSYAFVPQADLVRLNAEAEKRGRAVLFIDEWNRGDKALVNALFTLTDDRRIHDFHLHPNVLVVAAMNPSDGTYMVSQAERDHAVRKRLCFVYTTADLAGFLRHARSHDWHKLVPDFVQSMGQFLYDAGARDAGKAFACPSSWEKVSNILKAAEANKTPLTSTAVKILVEGQIGHTASQPFLEFVRDQSTVIQPADILEKYAKGGRARVAKLLGCLVDGTSLRRDPSNSTVRTDIISSLNRSLAVTLFSEMPDPEEIADNLAPYLLDLPDELYLAFWAEHMSSESGSGRPQQDYLSALNMQLKRVPKYSQRVKATLAGQRALAQELNKVS